MDIETKFEKLKKSSGDDMINKILSKKRDNKGVKMLVLWLEIYFSIYDVLVCYHYTLDTKTIFLCVGNLFNFIKLSVSVVRRQLPTTFRSQQMTALINLIFLC